jgi:hypothetical protein
LTSVSPISARQPALFPPDAESFSPSAFNLARPSFADHDESLGGTDPRSLAQAEKPHELSKSAVGDLLAKQPQKRTRDRQTAAFTVEEIQDLISKTNLPRTAIGQVNTCLTCFETTCNVEGRGVALSKALFIRCVPRRQF